MRKTGSLTRTVREHLKAGLDWLLDELALNADPIVLRMGQVADAQRQAQTSESLSWPDGDPVEVPAAHTFDDLVRSWRPNDDVDA